MSGERWWGAKRIGFDTETTGVDVFADRLVTACVVTVEPGSRPAFQQWLADPGVDIPDAAAAIHGVTTEYARTNGRPVAEVLFEVSAELALAMRHGVPIVGYNLVYDLSLLEAENVRHGVPTLAERLAPEGVGPCVDVRVLDQFVDRYRKGSRKLHDVCRHYQVALPGAHDASSDGLAAVRLATVIAARFPAVGDLSLAQLHEAQIGWHAEKQAGFAKYLRDQGKDASDVDGAWPVRQRPESRAA